MCSMCARISGVIAPIILILGDYWMPLPFMFFGINSIAAGLLALLLPETLGTSLPQTLQEGEDFRRKLTEKYDYWFIVSLMMSTEVV